MATLLRVVREAWDTRDQDHDMTTCYRDCRYGGSLTMSPGKEDGRVGPSTAS